MNDRGARFQRALPVRGMQLVRSAPGQGVPQTVAAFERDPRVAWAEPNYVRRPALVPNDPLLSRLWGLENTGQDVNGSAGTDDADIDATAAWDVTTGDPSVIVAVLDTGAILTHPDLAPNLWTNLGETAGDGIDNDNNGVIDDIHGADWLGSGPPDGDPTDVFAEGTSSHGTHVASTIAAGTDDSTGIAGVAPNVRVMPLRFLSPVEGNVADEIAAIAYARNKGARIVSGSFGGGPFSAAEETALATASDTLFVFAAGNDGHNNDSDPTPTYPCSYTSPNIICVAATDQDDAMAGFSNFGTTAVDLAAPGVNVLGGAAKPTMPVFTEGFGGPLAPTWTTGGTNNTWAITTAASAVGAGRDSPSGDYLANTDSFARRTPADLSGKAGCSLAYDLRLDTEKDFDPFLVETSTDGTTWSAESGWWGTTGGAFLPDFVDLTHRDGVAAMSLRFALVSDALVQGDGVYVDNVTLGCLASPGAYSGADDEYAFLSGTSMATPHVSGVAALVWSLDPSLTPQGVKARVLAGVDLLSGLAGKTLTGGRLNARWAVEPLPGAVTGSVTALGPTTATLNAAVQPRLQATSAYFEYGTTTDYASGATQIQQVPADGVSHGVSTTISGLQPDTVYHFRIVAQNATGTTVGADGDFTTPPVPPQPQPQTTPPPPPASLQTSATPPPPPPPAAPKAKPGPCAKLKGKRKAVCIRRRAALKKCVKLKAGPKKTKCIAKARRIK